MKKIFFLTLFLSFLVFILTIFAYSPNFSKERKAFLSNFKKASSYREEKVELDKGNVVSPQKIKKIYKGRVAIVLDDFGYENKIIDKVISLNLPLNPSIISITSFPDFIPLIIYFIGEFII